jgi:hypothetical protein
MLSPKSSQPVDWPLPDVPSSRAVWSPGREGSAALLAVPINRSRQHLSRQEYVDLLGARLQWMIDQAQNPEAALLNTTGLEIKTGPELAEWALGRLASPLPHLPGPISPISDPESLELVTSLSLRDWLNELTPNDLT